MQISIGTARIINKDHNNYLLVKYFNAVDKKTNIIIFSPNIEISLSKDEKQNEEVTIKCNNKITKFKPTSSKQELFKFIQKRTHYYETFSDTRVREKDKLMRFKELFKKKNIQAVTINQLNLDFQDNYEDNILIPIN